jgi:hypothetical protein
MPLQLSAILFPAVPRRVPCERGINIALRTAHLMVSSILLGGHVFDVQPSRLYGYLLLTIASGSGLILLELYRSCRWIYLGKGLLVLVKLALLGAAAVWWEHRVTLLLLVVVVATVGSHMPARFRYYSVIHGRVLRDAPERSELRSEASWRQ